MTILRYTFSIIRQHQKVFIVLNAAFYGLFILSMFLTLLAPDLQGYFQPDIVQAYAVPGLLKTAAGAYGSKNLLLAVAITFFVNLVVAVAMTTLSSFIVPFVGILAVLHRAVLWGVLFAPIGTNSITLIPHSLTLLIEGQAYVLAAFTAYVQGRMFLWLQRHGSHTDAKMHWEGYKAGVQATCRLYALVILTLLAGAIYEGVEVMYFMPIFLKS